MVITATANYTRMNCFPNSIRPTQFKMASTRNVQKTCDLALFTEEVQKYECLHTAFDNKFSKKYKDKNKKIPCWKAIGEKFDASPDQAEKKSGKNTRTAYGRFLNHAQALRQLFSAGGAL